MLEIDNLLIRQDGFELGANWSMETPQRLSLIGPSGAGKTTLLMAIAGFIQPKRGHICLDGEPIGGLAPGARPVSILFQSHNLFPHLSVFQNVALALCTDLKLSPTQDAKVTTVLEKVGLGHKAAQKPGELSGGQAQRAALARTLLRQKPLLLLDEPFAALGPALRGEMLSLVAAIAQETATTLIMVTHDPRDAKSLGGLCALVSNGTCDDPVGTADFFDNPSAALTSYLG